MTDDDNTIRATLHQMLNALKQDSELGQAGTKTVDLDQQAVGRLSRMDALQNQAMAQAQQRQRQAQMQRILAAIGRLDQNEYGYCTECGDEIPPARLSLDPAIPTCISCARG